MKKIILTFINLTFVTILWGQMVYVVKDDNSNNQFKSMVYKQWKFSPKWYYYNLWHGGLLGLHQGYTDTDRRTIKQLTPTTATTELSQSEWEKSHEAEKTMYEQEMKKFADRTIDTEYLLKKEDFDSLKERIGREMGKFSSNHISLSIAEPLYAEYDRIIKNINIIQDSHLENAKRRIIYQAMETELIELAEVCWSVNRMYKFSTKK